MTVDSIWIIVALCVLCLMVGGVCGAVLAIFIYDRGVERTARLHRTGNPVAVKGPDTSVVPGGEFRGLSEEAKAQQRAYHNVIERGAREFMAAEPSLSLEGARLKAREALEQVGAFRNGAAGG